MQVSGAIRYVVKSGGGAAKSNDRVQVRHIELSFGLNGRRNVNDIMTKQICEGAKIVFRDRITHGLSFFIRTPGPSPFSSTKMTPAASRAAFTAATLLAKPTAGPSLASMRLSVGTDTRAAAAKSDCDIPESARPAAMILPCN